MHRHEAVLVRVRVEQAELLASVHDIGRIVDIEHDAVGRLLVALAPKFQHGGLHAHEVAQARRILHPRDGGLGGKVGAGLRQASAGDLEHGVGAEGAEVVAVLVAAGDGEDAGTQNVGETVLGAGGVAAVAEGGSQGIHEADLPVGLGEQQQPAVRGNVAAVEPGRDFLAAQGWQRKRQEDIVGSGGHGRFCPVRRSGVSNRNLRDSRRLWHGRQRIPAMSVNKMG